MRCASMRPAAVNPARRTSGFAKGPQYQPGGTTPRNPPAAVNPARRTSGFAKDPQYQPGGTTPRNAPTVASPACHLSRCCSSSARYSEPSTHQRSVA